MDMENPDGTNKNQIEYFTINKRIRNMVLQTRCYLGSDCDNNHVLVVCSLKFKPKNLLTASRPKKNFQLLRQSAESKATYNHGVQQRIDLDKRKQNAIIISVDTVEEVIPTV